MIGDITTIMTKEWREFFISGGSRRTGLIFVLIIVAIFGFYLPYRAGQTLLASPWIVVLYSFVLPVQLMTNIIADAIAGERERHTLETLLASRLSDRAIILGKLGAAVGYSLALSVITALVGMVAANLQGGESFQFYSVGVFVTIVVFALLVSLLVRWIRRAHLSARLLCAPGATDDGCRHVRRLPAANLDLRHALRCDAAATPPTGSPLANWATVSLIAVALICRRSHRRRGGHRPLPALAAHSLVARDCSP